MTRKMSKFPEIDHRAINVDNSQVTGPLFFYTGEAEGAQIPEELASEPALDPVFKSAFIRRPA